MTKTLRIRTGLDVDAILRGSYLVTKWWVYNIYIYVHTQLLSRVIPYLFKIPDNVL